MATGSRRFRLIEGARQEPSVVHRAMALARRDGFSDEAIRAVLLQPHGVRTASQALEAFRICEQRVSLGLDPRAGSFETDTNLRALDGQFAGVNIAELPTVLQNGWHFRYDDVDRCSLIYRVRKDGTASGCFVPDIEIVSVDLLSRARFLAD